MKEATGELNMTVVTVVAIAAVAAFFYAFVWPTIKNNINSATKCSAAICPSTCTTGVCDCKYYDESGKAEEVKCKVENASKSGNNTGGQTGGFINTLK